MSRASASQISMLQQCPRKWYYSYILKIKEPKTSALLKGILVHSCIERFFKLKPNEKGCRINFDNYKTEFYQYMGDIFDDELIRKQWAFGREKPSIKQELIDTVGKELLMTEIDDAYQTVENFVTFYIMQFEQFAVKAKNFAMAFYMSRPKFQEYHLDFEDFVGYIDSVIEKDKKTILVDYKTSKIFRCGYTEEYIRQLKLYAYGYWREFGEIPYAGIAHFLRYGRELFFGFDESVIQEMEDLLAWFYENTQSEDIEDYPMNTEHQFCTNCQSKNPEGFRSGHRCWYDKFCNQELEGNTIDFKI